MTKKNPARRRSTSPWVAVKGNTGRIVGHMRRLSGAFEAERWAVRGTTEIFTCSLAAMEWILRRDGMQYQVKTGLSHQYFDGLTLSVTAAEAANFPSRQVAEIISARMDNPRSWDRVCVVGVHPEW